MSKADEILKKVQGIFKESEAKPEVKPEAEAEVALAEVVTSDNITIMFEGEELMEGSTVWVSVEGENVPLPMGEYELQDGRVLVVAEAGIVASVMAGEEAAPETEEIPETTQMSKEDILAAIKEAIEPLNAQIAKLSEEKKDLETKLSAHPAAKEIKPSPEGRKSNQIGVTLASKTDSVGLKRVYEMLYNN